VRRRTTLRGRIATLYAVLLIAVILAVGIVLDATLNRILLDATRARADRIGADIGRTLARSGAFVPLGDSASGSEALPLAAQIAEVGTLDHWASPTTYVEIDDAHGFPLGKSSNLGTSRLGGAGPASRAAVFAMRSAAVGTLLVRTERIASGRETLVVRVGENTEVETETIARIRAALAITVIAASAAVIGASFLLAAGVTRPLAELSVAMAGIRSDQLNRRIAWTNRADEVGDLARSFDAMLARLQESFARERRFVADASHELRTPLTVINANAQLLARWGERDAEIRQESIAAIIRESKALAETVDALLTLARAEGSEEIAREPVDLARIAEDVLRTLRSRGEAKGLALVLDADRDVIVTGEIGLLRVLIANLVENAVKFTESGGVTVRVKSAGTQAILAVRDTGMGLDPSVHELVFDRFHRTERARDEKIEGTGLGLAIVRTIVGLHGGTIAPEPTPGGGTTFVARLPRAAALLALLVVVARSGPVSAGAISAADDVRAPVIRLALGDAHVLVRSWDRPRVEVRSAAAVHLTRRTSDVSSEPSVIPILRTQPESGMGAALPAETFVVPRLSPGPRDLVAVRAHPGAGATTVFVPRDTALLVVQVADGSIVIRGTRDITLVARVHHGSVRLFDVSGSAFLQTGRGRILVARSDFASLRARTASGAVILRGCAFGQVDVTSERGDVVADGATFRAGPAVFSSRGGIVAVGARGDARLIAATPGRTETAFRRPALVRRESGGVDAVLGRGGVPVTTFSGRGIFLYDGALGGLRPLRPAWNDLRREIGLEQELSQ